MDPSTFIVPNEVQEILHRPPMKMKLIDEPNYVKTHQQRFVTSPNIFEPNSNRFHPQGLFSEEIFGSITSTDRFITEALIALNTVIIHPMIYTTVIKPKSLYLQILAGKQYAVFDETDFQFKLASIHTEGAGTGFQYFLKNIIRLAEAPAPSALRASNLHKLLVKYKDNLTISNLIVLPAGLRDIDLQSARLPKDDINKLYMNVINLVSSLTGYQLSEDPIFDGIRFQIQTRVADIYEYLMDMISGKGGFLQKHYGARKIAYSTRNVISVSTNEADEPNHVANIKSDETMIPMLNVIKCFQPFFTNYVKNRIFQEVFVHGSTERVAAINPKNLELEYITLRPAEANKYITSDGVNHLLNQFKHVGFRESPITIQDVNRNSFFVLLVFVDVEEQTVFVAKAFDELKRLSKKDIKKSDVHPMTWVEALYIASIHITKDKHALITRYPALGDGSIYPSKVHPITTTESNPYNVIFDTGFTVFAPHYPKLGNAYYESIIVHTSRLSGLGGDFDGDMVSCTTLWSKEGNEDIRNNLESVSSVIGQDMKLKIGAWGDIVNLALHNLSRQDIEE